MHYIFRSQTAIVRPQSQELPPVEASLCDSDLSPPMSIQWILCRHIGHTYIYIYTHVCVCVQWKSITCMYMYTYLLYLYIIYINIYIYIFVYIYACVSIMNMHLHLSTMYTHIMYGPFETEVQTRWSPANTCAVLSQDSLPRCSRIWWWVEPHQKAANKSQAQRVFKRDSPHSSAQYWGANSSTPCHSPILNFTPPQLLSHI